MSDNKNIINIIDNILHKELKKEKNRRIIVESNNIKRKTTLKEMVEIIKEPHYNKKNIDSIKINYKVDKLYDYIVGYFNEVCDNPKKYNIEHVRKLPKTDYVDIVTEEILKNTSSIALKMNWIDNKEEIEENLKDILNKTYSRWKKAFGNI